MGSAEATTAELLEHHSSMRPLHIAIEAMGLFRLHIARYQREWASRAPDPGAYRHWDSVVTAAFQSGAFDRYFLKRDEARQVLTDVQRTYFESWRDADQPRGQGGAR